MKLAGGLFIFLIILSGGIVGAAPWNLNDVSILLPLPRQKADLDFLLKKSDRGQFGELVPSSVLERIPDLSTHHEPHELLQSLRVVAIRIDPRFPGFDPQNPENCRRQIRLVWQPIREREAPWRDFTTVDAALHSFYDLTKEEFQSLLDELRRLPRTANEPLKVHPIIEREGTQGPYATTLRSIVLQFVG